MKILKWINDNILFLLTLFLLLFIPLYPKLPLLDIKNTWVYIRVEDFVVVFVLSIWAYLLFHKKISLKTPLTMPILLFWIIGAIATIHGVILIFPTLANVFPNVAFLSFLRRIEYLSLFFVAYAGLRDKRFLIFIIATVCITLLLVVGYGIGQRYLGFPAFLTMNEEFAKGEPIRLSQLSRVPSTFAGHYDLAAYLVLVIPILASLIFGVRKWFVKLFLLILIGLGFASMFMTVSRVSFFVLVIALGVVLLFQKKKIIIVMLPVIAALSVLFVSFTPALLDRFGNTIKEVDVLVDATTGDAIGHARIVSAEYFKDKIIIQDYALRESKVEGASIYSMEDELFASSSAVLATGSANVNSKLSGIVPYYNLAENVTLLVPVNTSTGENLPQGTGYINLSLSPVSRKIGEYFYEQRGSAGSGDTADVVIINGNFLVKRAAAYDLSFTTRFQGEWPHAMQALMRNVLLGSGYGSVSLAIDNNYLRILGEVGLLGAAAFFTIFLTIGIYIRKVLPHVESSLVKSFVIGYLAGVTGLALNALFIDVFEASKVAFILWLLTGVTLGALHLYQKENIDMYKELKKAAVSTPAVIVYLFITTIVIFSPMISNYFVGDDFTWFRWAAEGGDIMSYFTKANGFFYRPGTKIYFLLMYKLFWLNQAVYHMVSIFLHFVVVVLVFLLAKKIVRDYVFAILGSFLFLFISGYSEAVFWISSTGYLFTAVFSLLSLLFFIQWEEKQHLIYFVASLISFILGLLFHELGVVIPLLLMFYKYSQGESSPARILKKPFYFILFLPLVVYWIFRFMAGSHWLSGDYNYNLLKLPFNTLGNILGYSLLTFFGPTTLSFYNTLRSIMRERVDVSLVLSIILIIMLYYIYRFMKKSVHNEDRRVISFCLGIFFIGLLPFLGLGNIASRYSYVSAIGAVLLLSFMVKKFYFYLRPQGKDVALASVTVIMTLFFLMHLIQVQEVHSDWNTAGKKAERFLVAIDEVYSDYWAKEPMTFYFINVPIKTGEAWIFPVGLKDAIWFSFRNPDIYINYSASVNEALQKADGSRNEKVFEFDESGKIIEHRKILNDR